VLVEEGTRIEAGQGVVVVEAMKMENEIAATRSGRIAAIRVKPGQSVESGAELALIE
jgi:biotin carboxyl carrier protein